MIWKILPGTTRVLFWVVLAWMIYSVKFGKRSARVIHDGRIEFTPHRYISLEWLLLIYCCFSTVAGDYMHGNGNSLSSTVSACFGMGSLSLLFSFPGTIVVADDGLEQRYWFRMDKRIGWKNIEEIKSVKWSTVTITGTDGTKIVHSPMLADRPRFLLELKRHCGEELPPDFPREPIEDL
ncbi:MAG: hypothetical protein ACLQLH_10555 [Terracidiphilus sp.]|jgi:hypothetical protein